MVMLKTLAMLEALKMELLKYGKIEDLRAQEVDTVLYLFLEYRNIVLSRGMLY
jgi:hypothetical protein